jgi:predicted nucleotidyltransferase
VTRPLDIAPEHLAQVQAILKAHLPAGVRVQVFGSRARGGAKPFSDLDLALVAEGPVDQAVLARLADAFEESSLPWRVDLIDWSAISDSFRDAIRGDLVAMPVQYLP